MARPKGGNLLEDSVHLGIRVDGETNEGLKLIAASQGISKSEVARKALENLVAEAIAARKRKRT